jgi:hypothetical protein
VTTTFADTPGRHPIGDTLNESAFWLIQWNDFAQSRWDTLTEDQQWKQTHFTKAKWKWRTMHCNGGAPQYSFDPAAPDYASLSGDHGAWGSDD